MVCGAGRTFGALLGREQGQEGPPKAQDRSVVQKHQHVEPCCHCPHLDGHAVGGARGHGAHSADHGPAQPGSKSHGVGEPAGLPAEGVAAPLRGLRELHGTMQIQSRAMARKIRASQARGNQLPAAFSPHSTVAPSEPVALQSVGTTHILQTQLVIKPFRAVPSPQRSAPQHGQAACAPAGRRAVSSSAHRSDSSTATSARGGDAPSGTAAGGGGGSGAAGGAGRAAPRLPCLQQSASGLAAACNTTCPRCVFLTNQATQRAEEQQAAARPSVPASPHASWVHRAPAAAGVWELPR
jgi:hypothetical protein